MRQSHQTALHGMSLLQRLPAQDLNYILQHPRQIKELVQAKAKPKVAKAPPALGIMRLRAVVVAMGFKTPADMANALLALNRTRVPQAARSKRTNHWSRRKLFPERRAAIVVDIKGGLTISQLASKHKVSPATISRIKRDEGLVGHVAPKTAHVPEPAHA